MTEAIAQLRLQRNQDRRVRGGHPWIFSNEVASVEPEPRDGGLVDVLDDRGAFLGRAYYNRHSLIRARVMTRGRDPIDVDFFARRLERALRYRERVVPGLAAYRLVHSEADQLPGLVIDRYGDWLAVQITTLGMEARADLLREAIERVLSPRGVMRIADSPLRLLEGLPLERSVWWGDVPERVELSLDGFAVEADLHHGQKTGLFLDQRENRRWAEEQAAGLRVLDLFCYQGEWTLLALRGGAAEVVAVDSSEPALAAAARNVARHGGAERVQFRRGDVFDEQRALLDARERFGLVILDPPALIKSKSHLAAGARAYRELNRGAMQMLTEGGTLITCSCSHHLDDMLFRQVLLEAARMAKRPFRVRAWAGAAADHPQLLAVPETHYLKCAVLQAL
ncbi:MAG: class I SAM-dependent rRNA methyltransferase [Candidatus Eisenbacteria bacterium]|uniref:Class I SAM-dependent rRNA methyltransferase n=1 Tax=Eiseniibacteriota bacterium TaxID=2212470 RepID=A0A849T0P6_UNCEI|nr:class I SAM-dependent rRNA methyltransferase [Candidatus Eisenbacteria bacterium]